MMSLDYGSLSKNWDPWAHIPERYNLGVALTAGNVAAGRGDRPVLHWSNQAGATRSLTYGELDRLSDRLAVSLQRLGVNFGDRVFLRLPNIPEFYIAALGIAKAGGVFIPSSTQFRVSEIEYRLRDSAAVAVITTSELLPEVEAACRGYDGLKHVIVVSYPHPDQRSAPHLDFSELIADDVTTEAWHPADTRHDDLGFIAYTSGTTGDPKGVVHYQRYPIAYEGLIRYWHDYRDDDIVACPSELGWLLPVASTFLYALGRGLTVVLYDAMGQRFDPVRWFELIQKHRITNFTATPTVYRMLMAAADRAGEFDLSSWRHAVSAGEPLPADTLSGIQEQFGVTPLDGIGMSECMVYCFNHVGMPLREGSCGHPGPGTVIELMDLKFNPVPPDTEGVLCVRRDSHPGMMREYWNKPERTAEIFHGEWYVSGDVLTRDRDGYFWFKGRADDVMKASGYRISPFEVESCLLEHPAVLEAAAVTSPDPVRGSVVKAFIVLRPEFTAGEPLMAELQEFARKSMAPYKYPRKIEFLASLPKTTSGKIRRKLLREQEERQAAERATV
jgi:acetyl-CoA synthetase